MWLPRLRQRRSTAPDTTKTRHTEPLNPSAAYRTIRSTGTDFVPGAVPAHLENATGAPVAVDQASRLEGQEREERMNEAASFGGSQKKKQRL